jgi:hypothetical protein
MLNDEIRPSRVVLVGFVLSLACLAVVTYYTASDTWGPVMVSAYEEPPWIVNYPGVVDSAINLLFLLNPPTMLLVIGVVIPAIDAPAQVDAWLFVVLNLLGSVAWWWMLARVSRWRRSRSK